MISHKIQEGTIKRSAYSWTRMCDGSVEGRMCVCGVSKCVHLWHLYACAWMSVDECGWVWMSVDECGKIVKSTFSKFVDFFIVCAIQSNGLRYLKNGELFKSNLTTHTRHLHKYRLKCKFTDTHTFAHTHTAQQDLTLTSLRHSRSISNDDK